MIPLFAVCGSSGTKPNLHALLFSAVQVSGLTPASALRALVKLTDVHLYWEITPETVAKLVTESTWWP
jgi:hypothetical protein